MTADSPLKLDERTEQLIEDIRFNRSGATHDERYNALRTRIRELVAEGIRRYEDVSVEGNARRLTEQHGRKTTTTEQPERRKNDRQNGNAVTGTAR